MYLVQRNEPSAKLNSFIDDENLCDHVSSFTPFPSTTTRTQLIRTIFVVLNLSSSCWCCSGPWSGTGSGSLRFYSPGNRSLIISFHSHANFNYTDTDAVDGGQRGGRRRFLLQPSSEASNWREPLRRKGRRERELCFYQVSFHLHFPNVA